MADIPADSALTDVNKRPKEEEKDIVQRLRPLARLQTAEDFENFRAVILCKNSQYRGGKALMMLLQQMNPSLRKRLDHNSIRRAQAKANLYRDYYSSERLAQLRASGCEVWKVVKVARDNQLRNLGPLLERVLRSADHSRSFHLKASFNSSLYYVATLLHLANCPSLHLLTPAKLTLCSQLRISPRPYFVIKETLIQE
ncbi:hypothetical protein CY34DRAFT_17369 [Suillus luteus UH-Slu-Lm8-n1]|uniref:Uncharacterized protein n=1 Tax=Suillus luteus UH-Slu-Lm8-n1 TaxID=930992 RepID=A0A0D0AKZ9_9AGAM|nr:hypothetical protein CY34DRAFT_17369 [Suillus luteus UH-Slu-Lm8-n1]